MTIPPTPQSDAAPPTAHYTSDGFLRHPDNERQIRRNYWANILDGSQYIAALTFVNATTLLPRIVQRLGGPDWLIALTPTASQLGAVLLPLLVAHRVGRLTRYMPFMLVTGAWQRVPFLFAAIMLWCCAGSAPWLALAAVMMAPLVSGLMAGCNVTTWQQLLMKTIPADRRASLFGWRSAVSGVLGLGAGVITNMVIERYPGIPGYAILYFLAFLLLAGSFAALAAIKETVVPHDTPPRETHTLLETLRALPGLLRTERRYTLYLCSRFFRNGIFILTPFLAIYARATLGLPDTFIAQLLVVQTLGTIVGTLIAGQIGDRFGSKAMIVLSTIFFIGISLWAMLAHTSWEFITIFSLFGLAVNAGEIGYLTLNMHICPVVHRTIYLAVGSFVNLPGMLLAAWYSSTMWRTQGQQLPALVAASIVCLLIAVLAMLPIREHPHAPTA